MIVIGSTAIKYWYPDFKREPVDIDVICNDTTEDCINNRWETLMLIRESKKVERLSNPIMLDRYSVDKSSSLVYVSPDDLCTLKASHLCWNINWEKHMFDLQFLLKKGNKINPELFKKLYDHWNVFHGRNKRSDLKMSKEDFFTNAVNYDTMEHDEMHKIINSTPIYTRVLKDGAEVELDENKFHALSHKEKLEFVREECYIMAFERYKDMRYRFAFELMLKKFIISHAPFWSLLFIFENYVELEKCQINFIKIIEDGLQCR